MRGWLGGEIERGENRERGSSVAVRPSSTLDNAEHEELGNHGRSGERQGSRPPGGVEKRWRERGASESEGRGAGCFGGLGVAYIAGAAAHGGLGAGRELGLGRARHRGARWSGVATACVARVLEGAGSTGWSSWSSGWCGSRVQPRCSTAGTAQVRGRARVRRSWCEPRHASASMVATARARV